MEPIWYYARNGKQYGPVSENEIRGLVEKGDLRGTDLIWKKGAADWVEIRSVPGMVAELEPIPEIPRSRKERRDRDERPEPRREERSRGRDDRYPDDLDDEPRGRGRGRYRDERDDRDDRYSDDRWDDRRGPSGPPVDVFGSLMRHIKRMFTWNIQKVEPTADEKETLTRSGITDETTQRYSVWRRSVLWVTMGPTYLFALLAMIGHFSDFGVLSVFGILAYLVLIVANFALPTGALLAAMNYDRLGRSSFWLMSGVVISFLIPILVAMIPAPWLIKDNPRGGGGSTLLNLYIMLIPAVLAILPGVSRGCLRVKSILPASVLAGWGYVLSVPLQILFSLAIFIVIYQLLSFGYSATLLLLMGVLCWFASPAIYLVRMSLLTRAASRSDMQSIMSLAMIAQIATAVGVFLVITFLFVASDPGGGSLLGFGRSAAIKAYDIDLHKSWIEYICRSLLMAVLFADLLIRMNLAMWRQERALTSSDLQQEYNQAMENLSNLVAKGDPLLDRQRRNTDDDDDQPQRTLTVDQDDPPPRRSKPSAPLPPRSRPVPEPKPPVEMSPEEPPRDEGLPKPF